MIGDAVMQPSEIRVTVQHCSAADIVRMHLLHHASEKLSHALSVLELPHISNC